MKKLNLSQKIKWTLKFFIIFVGAMVVFTVARKTKKQEIKIVEKTKTIYRIKKIPISRSDYINCYKSQIEIDVKTRDDWLDVTAGDLCKESNRAFRIKLKGSKWGMVMGFQSGMGLNHSMQPSFYVGVGLTYGFVLF